MALGSTFAAIAAERATDGPRVKVHLANPPQDYGITSTSVFTVPAFGFQSADGTTLGHFAPQYYNRYSPTGAEVEAPLMLPSGASVTGLEFEGCDSSAADDVVYILFSVNSDGSFNLLSSLFSTTGTPGCGVFFQAVTPFTIDNTNTYYVAVRGGTGTDTGFTAVRVYYNLQVSPAPLVATFSDVPTGDGAFQFIEAFVSAGVTVGCDVGPPARYCPDDFVTRRQMAVFFAKALGLHFVP